MLITSAVLFGGWFAYRSLAMETPLQEAVRDLDGIVEAEIEVDSDTVRLQLTLEPDADLRAIMAKIREEGGQALKNRQIRLSINNDVSEQLDAWWSSALFEVAEAMEHRRYSAIPEALERHLDRLPGLTAAASMDEEFVYIRLTRGGESKFVVLPRTPAQMGVWPNE
jgi:hypothetical protein